MNKLIDKNPPSRGRPKGSENRITTEFRETVKSLLEENSQNVSRWLSTVAEGDGDQVKPDPKGALDMLAKLAEFAAPKLARTEVVGDEQKPIRHIYQWKK